MMLSRAFVLAAFAVCFVHGRGMPLSGEGANPSYKAALEKFIEMVEKHNLNVTVIVSDVQQHVNRRTKSLKDMALELPVNNEKIKESKLTKEEQEKWVKLIDEMDIPEVRKGAARVSNVKTKEVEIIDKPLLETPTYQRIVNFDEKLGRPVFLNNNPNIEAWHNMKLENSKMNVILRTSNAQITELKRGSKIKDSTVDVLLSILPQLSLMFDDDTEYAKAIVRVMDEKVPDMNWNVIVGAENFNLKTDDWALVRVIQQNVLLYSGNE